MLLESHGQFEVVGEAANAWQAVEVARQCHPDVVVMDIAMEGNGLTATRQLHEEIPQLRVLVLTMHGGDEYFFRALEAGATGYVLKEAASTDLITAIQVVAGGGVFLYPSLADKLVRDYLSRASGGDERGGYEKLTPREKQILALVAQGHTNQEIAEKLSVSASTVQTHRAHIMEKLNLDRRSELIDYAIRIGLLRR
ncbi:MAG: response regulator transcription factor [Chloroflexi bacterium]|nr:response regulator transcription factor [Chloroflexota bacterium]